MATIVTSPVLPGGAPTKWPSAAASDGESLKYDNATGRLVWYTPALPTGTLAQFAATTSAQLAGVISDETGTGALVFASSPTLVTPALGTPASGVATNLTGTAAGLTAGNVTTNANLTGHVTSVGNAASLGSFTLAQLNTAVIDATLVDNALVATAIDTSAELAAILTNETGTGLVVFNNAPTFVGPVLGTPASGTLTNCDGYVGDASLVTVGTITSGTWNGTAIEGTAIASTGEAGGTKYLREDGDGTSSWQAVSAGVDVSGTPLVNQVGIWVDADTQKGDSGLIWDGSKLGVGAASPGGITEINSATATDIALIVQTTDDSTTKNLIEAQNAAGTAFTWVTGDGKLMADMGTGETNSFYVGGAGNASISGDGYNTLIGVDAGRDLTSGHRNTLIGGSCGLKMTTGARNTLFGTYVAYNGIITGSNNVGAGTITLMGLTSGSGNVCMGYQSGKAISTQNYNCGYGYNSLQLCTGTGNIALGYAAGKNLTSGSYNISIGYNAQLPTATASNQLNIGGTIWGDLSNKLIAIGGTTIPTTASLEVRTATATYDGINVTSTDVSGTNALVKLDFSTADGSFIDFVANADADATSAVSTLTTSGATTHHIQISINGTPAWIAVSTTDPT